jgi:Putative metallopeptidase
MTAIFVRQCLPMAPMLVLLGLAACGPVPEEGKPAAETPPTAEPAEPAALAAPAAPKAHANIPASFKRTASGGVRDTGDFVVQYEETRNESYQEIEAIFKETRLLEDTIQELNGVFSLPTDVPVVMRECGEVNAFYDPESGEISLCYELVEHYSEIFMADAQTDEEQEEAGASVASATMFTFFHEMGHALIDIYDLPITGREEDAVDQLATLILLQGGEDGENAAIDGANSFVGSEEEEMDDLAFWDEHSLDDQRFYNIVCWIYGKDPEGYQYFVEDETLPANRAQRCPAEYNRLSTSWESLLDPYVKG